MSTITRKAYSIAQSARLIWAILGVAPAWACEDGGPCESEGAERRRGVCDCPEGTRLFEDRVARISRCVPDGSGTVATVTDSGRTAMDAGKDAAFAAPVVAFDATMLDTFADGSRQPDAATPGDASFEVAASDAGAATLACVPAAESCDQMDNDCDGQIDNGVKNECGACGKLAHPKGETCSNGGQGLCAKPGLYTCMGETTVCNAPAASPSAEMCDNVDNDCDGTVDDGITKNQCLGCASLAHPLKSACTDGMGECRVDGTWECMGTEAVVCTAKAKPPGIENCNGKDDDCDGAVDEGFANACGGACMAAVPSEDCSTTTKDDNCNGQINEGCPPVCIPTIPAAEVCDSKDNNCDGRIDEGVLNDCGGCATPDLKVGATCLAAKARCNVVSAWSCQQTAFVCESSKDCLTTTSAISQERVVGLSHTCARYSDGTVQCWGKMASGNSAMAPRWIVFSRSTSFSGLAPPGYRERDRTILVPS